MLGYVGNNYVEIFEYKENLMIVSIKIRINNQNQDLRNWSLFSIWLLRLIKISYLAIFKNKSLKNLA